MNDRRLQTILLVLLVAASLLTTALLGLMVLRRQQTPAPTPFLHADTQVPARALVPSTSDTSPPSPWQPSGSGVGSGMDDLPAIAEVPAFELTDQTGTPYGRNDLLGRVWLADFIFTRCSGPCPIMTHRMSLLQHTLAQWPDWDDIRLVSFSVDPTHDTPDVLAAYARRFEADSTHWRFLTGSRDEIWELSQKGFLLGVGEDPGDPDMPIFHSQKVALVDRAGRVRGYYNIMQQRDRDALLDDLRRLLTSSGGAGAVVTSDAASDADPKREE